MKDIDVVKRVRIADAAFQSYKFGDGVTVVDHDNWNRDDPNDFIKIAYVTYDDDPQGADSHKVSFHVCFNQRSEVSEVYALEVEHGNEIGMRGDIAVFESGLDEARPDTDKYSIGVTFDSSTPIMTLAALMQDVYDNNGVSGFFHIERQPASECEIVFDRYASDDGELVSDRIPADQPFNETSITAAAADQLLAELTEFDCDPALAPIMQALKDGKFSMEGAENLRRRAKPRTIDDLPPFPHPHPEISIQQLVDKGNELQSEVNRHYDRVANQIALQHQVAKPDNPVVAGLPLHSFAPDSLRPAMDEAVERDVEYQVAKQARQDHRAYATKIEDGINLWERQCRMRRDLEKALNSGSAATKVWFARSEPLVGPDEEALLEKAVLASGDASAIVEYAEYVEGADIAALQEAVIKTGDATAMYRFAAGVDGANIASLQHGIIESGSAQDMLYFANYIPRADRAALQAGIIASGDARIMLEFAEEAKDGADISALQAGVLASNDADAKFRFARKVPGADVLALWHSVCDSGDSKIIDAFRNEMGREIDRLQSVDQKLVDFGKLLMAEGTPVLQNRFNELFGAKLRG